jgi:hypothetical protein
LGGGVPPYTVDFRNLTFDSSNSGTTFMQWAGDPNLYPLPSPVTLTKTYFGGDGGIGTSVRTNVAEGEDVYVRVTHEMDGGSSSWPDLDAASYLGFFTEVWGYVKITDSVGTSKSWWVDSECNSGGINITTNPGVPLPVYRWDWSHFYDCTLCTGDCEDEYRIYGYP